MVLQNGLTWQVRPGPGPGSPPCLSSWTSTAAIASRVRGTGSPTRQPCQRGSLTVWFTDEATTGGFKQVIGDGLCSRADERRATVVDIAVHALKRMSELGRPNYVRTA